MTKRSLLLILPLALGGCVQTQGALVYGTFEVPAEHGGFCENYARQTYHNVFNDGYDSRDGFGARQFGRAQAERAADRAYQRCLSGRTN